MILGIGTDLVDIGRIGKILQRHGIRFEGRCFSQGEQNKAKNRGESGRVPYYAKRFAAKEACVKAMGSGFVGDIYLKDITISETASGQPFLTLSGGALKRLGDITPAGLKPALHLSLSDEKGYALAFVVIEAV